MIAPSAVRNYLARQLDNFDWLKECSEQEINKEYEQIRSDINPALEPMLHQKVCLLIGTSLNRFLFFLDMGTGKTKISLDLIQYYKNKGEIKSALILVPNRVNVQTWIDEVKKHQPKLSVREIQSLDDSLCNINIALYARICRMASDTSGKKWKIDEKKIKALQSMFDCLILDESTAIKNSASLSYRVSQKISKACNVCYALTGTPHGRNALDLWAQFNAVDLGDTLGTKGMFQEALFEKETKMRIRVKGRLVNIDGFVLPKKSVGKLTSMIKHRSIRYETAECVTLPDMVESRLPFALGPNARNKYDELMEEVKENSDTEEVKRTFTMMRQIASGFMYVRLFDGSDREVVVLDEVNERVETLIDCVKQFPQDSKFVVFHEFLYSGATIDLRLKKEGIKSERIYSGSKKLDKILSDFNQPDKGIRALVINNQSGAFGLNLQVANYALFYESPVSPIVREQANRRIHRHGQTKTTFLYNIAARWSVDNAIYAMLKEGKDLFDEVVNGRAKLQCM